MTIVKTLDVFCDADVDGEMCAEWGYGCTGVDAVYGAARARVRESGWTHRNGKDLCPEHSGESA